MKTHRVGVRVSADLYELLAVAGDISAATRALAILGAAAAGYELDTLNDEAASLLAASLDPPLRTALRGLLLERSTAVPPVFVARSTVVEPALNTPTSPVELLLSDPLADIGIDV